MVKVETGEISSGAEENAASTFFGILVVDEDVDVFDLGEVADDLGVDPGDGLEFSGPILGVVGPADPGSGVRRPFGGHAIAGWFLVGAQWYPLPVQKCAKSSIERL
jgi:hypothetical protein